MKILFCSDFHLNLKNRIDDFIKSMEQIYEATKKVDAVYILGDIYHSRNPHPKTQEIFRKWIKKIKCKKYIILGNHDLNLDTNTLNEFNILGGAKVIKPPYIVEVDNKNIYLDHILVQGAKLGASNLNLNLQSAIPLKELLKNKCDLYLLGHVHKIQAVSKNPPVIYIGSIERIDFAERNEDKYYITLDTEKWKLTYHKLDIRHMFQFEIDLNKDIPTGFINIKNAIVKVIIKGTKEQLNQFNRADLLEKLSESYRYKIIDKVVREKKSRNKNINESKSTQDCFTEYAKLNKFTHEEIQKGLEVIE